MKNKQSKPAEQNTERAAPVAAPAKSFMTAGPTLHYSHTNVLWLWFLAVVVYVATCSFWYAIVTGGTFSVSLKEITNPSLFDLGHCVVSPISIYQYPAHILVLGTLMGGLAAGPLLVSQLLSFRYCTPLILALMFIAKLYLFGVFVLVSCIAVASRPLRFRSRFIALALCMAPQLIYWAAWGGGDKTVDPVRWGLSYAPWIYAWLSGLAMAAVVLGIGHFTRYKPGLNWLIGLVFLTAAFGVFRHYIGFAELDYQRDIAGSDPEDASEFQDQSIAETLDKVFADNTLRSRLEGQFFNINDSADLRLKLKERIQATLDSGEHWPEWFRQKIPERLKYQNKRQTLIAKYDTFIAECPATSHRLPAAMYFRAMLSEMRPDVRDIVESEMLRFYSDYPFADNNLNWRELLERFPGEPEAIEARWRIAMDEAGKGNFDTADEYCRAAIARIAEVQAELSADPSGERGSIAAAFQKPAITVMTPFKLYDLQNRILKLRSDISEENQGPDDESRKRLAEFLRLNPYHERSYAVNLDGLLEKMPDDDGLRDNVLLAKAVLADDLHRRLELLEALIKQYPQRDAGIQARYEMGLTTIRLHKDPMLSEEQKEQLLTESKQILADFIEQYPDSPFAAQAREKLRNL